MDESTKRIGMRIRSRRQEMDMTQEELAAKTGYKTKGAIAKIENGYCSMKQSVILNFAKALNVSPAWLLGQNETDHLMRKDSIEIPISVIKPYFENTETGVIAKELAYNPQLKLLFDAAKDATPEQLKQVHDMLVFLKQKERGGEDE